MEAVVVMVVMAAAESAESAVGPLCRIEERAGDVLGGTEGHGDARAAEYRNAVRALDALEGPAQRHCFRDGVRAR